MSSAKKHKSKKHQEESVVDHQDSHVEQASSSSSSAKKNIREKMIHQEVKKSAKSTVAESPVENLQVVDVDAGAVSQESAASQSHGASAEESSEEPTQLSFEESNGHSETESHQEEEKKKIQIQFLGSDLVRAKFPQPFDVAEKLATDWVNDGDFSEIPLGNPLLSSLAAEGLRKAKDVERNVTANPNFQLAKGILEAQLEEVLKKWKK